jgi:phenylacetate-CoA ligase
MMSLLETYKKSPVALRESLKLIYGSIPFQWRLDSTFKRQMAFLRKSQWWSQRELENYQNAQLFDLIRHAYSQVPYYRQVMAERNLIPADIRHKEDLHKLPLLTKRLIRENFQRLKADNIPEGRVIVEKTSGTTGEPLRVLIEKDKNYFDWDPFVLRSWGWAGYQGGDLIATFAGWGIDGKRIGALNKVRRILILSSFHLNLTYVGEYARWLKSCAIKFLHGYPSSLVLFTRLLKTARTNPPIRPKGIFCFAENLTEFQRRELESFWGCGCFNYYSMKERCVLAAECEYHAGLHLCPEFGITEFVDSASDGYTRIVATSLTNYAMPLIRYDTEDMGYLSPKTCGCNRHFPLLELQGGRQRSFAVAKDGTSIPVTSMDMATAVPGILQFQFVQHKRGELDLNIVGSRKSDDCTDKILSYLKSRLGSNMDVRIHFVDQLIKTVNGKTPEFVQRMRDGHV